MAAQKFVALVGGKLKEIFGVTTATADAIPALDGTGRISVAQMPVGIGAEIITAAASEALTAGNFVNVYNNAGTIAVRKADATTNAKPANGFVLASFANAASATVFLISQTNTALTGLTGGVEYFLSTTPGGVTPAAPATAGNLVQFLGFAGNATSVVFSNLLTVEVA